MEYQSNSNHNSNSAAVIASTNSIASSPASGSENRKPATAQQLIRENVQFLIQQLEAGKSEALTAFLDAMVHFPNYSFGNVLLIARQKPQATHVAGMWAWNQLGRRVKRGEKGIAILAPMIAKTRKDNINDGDEARVRSFTYDGLSRLVCAANPENSSASCPASPSGTIPAGVLHYVYDLDGNVASRTDARGAVTNYTYDPLNRIISKTFSGYASFTPPVTYAYDSGSPSGNFIGHLAYEYTGSQAAPLLITGFQAYDAMGRVRGEVRCAGGACSASSPAVTYGYDLVGNIASTTVANAGPAMTFSSSYDPANRLASVTSTYGGDPTNPTAFDATKHPNKLFSAEAAGAYGAVGLVNPLYGILSLNGSNSPATLSGAITYDHRMRVTSASYTSTGVAQ